MTHPTDAVKRPGTRIKRSSARGTLLAIALLLASSAVVRLYGVTGQALARGVAEAQETGAPDEATPKVCQSEADMAALLSTLLERERAVEAREAALADRARALDLAESEVRENLEALTAAEEALRGTMALAQTAAEDDIARLTSVYENMKPRDAAALFQAMAPEFAAGFLGRMRPEAAAGIMAGLPAETAYGISVVLAGRNANAPKN